MGRKLVLFISFVVVLQALIWSRLPETSHPKDCDCGDTHVFLPTEASPFLPQLCRRVVISHQNHISTSVYDCGSESGSAIVLLHGFPDSPETWRHQVDALVQEDFRVIIPTMRGYETSSQVDSYHVTQLANDVVCITQALGVKQYDVIGHDWGAIVGQVLAISRSADVRTFVSVAVPPAIVNHGGKLIAEKPSQLLNSWYMLFFQVPFLPEYLLQRSPFLTLTLIHSWSPSYNWREDKHQWEIYDRIRSPGVAHAAVNYYRQNLMAGVKDSFSRLINANKLAFLDEYNPIQAPIPVDTLLVTGKDDGCIDSQLYDVEVPGVFSPKAHKQIIRLAGGHYVHYENPSEFNEKVIRFLTRRPATPSQ